MKKVSIMIVVMLVGLVGVSHNVSAQEIFYENEKGVVFTKEQYEFFSAMYYDGYQSIMSQEDFDSFEPEYMNKDLVESKIARNYGINPLGTEVGTPAKTLKISKLNTSNVKISVTLVWHGNPTIRSYDVMGAYLSGVNLLSGVTTMLSYSTGGNTANDIKQLSNGFGVSIKLPVSGNDIKLTQTYSVSKGGRVYASYQHAMDTVNLSLSQSYTIGIGGYGHVFIFNNGAMSHYDGMDGVDIDV